MGQGGIVIEEIEHRHRQAVDHGDNGIIHGHGDAVNPKSEAGLQMVQNVCKQGHHNIGAGDAGDALEDLADEHDGEIGRVDEADHAAQNRDHKADEDHILLAEAVGKGADKEHARGQRHAADEGQKRLGGVAVERDAEEAGVFKIGVGEDVEHIAALEHDAHLVEEVEDHDDPPVAVRGGGLELHQGGRTGILRAGVIVQVLLGDALAGEQVLNEAAHKGDGREQTHNKLPAVLQHVVCRRGVDPAQDHGHEDGAEQAVARHGGDVGHNRQKAALLEIARGERNHKEVRAAVDRVCKRGKEVEGHGHPDHAKAQREIRDDEHHHARHCKHRAGGQDEGPGLALAGLGLAQQDADQDVAQRHRDNRQQRQQNQEPALGHHVVIGAVEGEVIGADDGGHSQHKQRAQEVAQGHLPQTDLGLGSA